MSDADAQPSPSLDNTPEFCRHTEPRYKHVYGWWGFLRAYVYLMPMLAMAETISPRTTIMCMYAFSYADLFAGLYAIARTSASSIEREKNVLHPLLPENVYLGPVLVGSKCAVLFPRLLLPYASVPTAYLGCVWFDASVFCVMCIAGYTGTTRFSWRMAAWLLIFLVYSMPLIDMTLYPMLVSLADYKWCLTFATSGLLLFFESLSHSPPHFVSPEALACCWMLTVSSIGSVPDALLCVVLIGISIASVLFCVECLMNR